MSFGAIGGIGDIGGGGGLSQEDADLLYAPIALATTVTNLIATVDARDTKWRRLADETLLTAASSWTGPTGLGSYDEIMVEITGRTTQGSSTGAVNVRFNGDSVSGHYINSSGGSSTWLVLGAIAGSLTNTDRWGHLVGIVQNRDTTLHTVQAQYALTESNGSPPNSQHVVQAVGHFNQTGPITSLTIHPNSSTDFVAGTRFQVFGRI